MAYDYRDILVSQGQRLEAGFENHQRGDAELAAQYRLTPERFDAATNWTADDNVSKKERIETFLKNEQRYHQARRDGLYTDIRNELARR
jgi:hypothetical protein